MGQWINIGHGERLGGSGSQVLIECMLLSLALRGVTRKERGFEGFGHMAHPSKTIIATTTRIFHCNITLNQRNIGPRQNLININFPLLTNRS